MRNLLIQAVAFLCMFVGALATPLAAASTLSSPNDRNPWTPIGSDWEMRLRPSWQVMSEPAGPAGKVG